MSIILSIQQFCISLVFAHSLISMPANPREAQKSFSSLIEMRIELVQLDGGGGRREKACFVESEHNTQNSPCCTNVNAIETTPSAITDIKSGAHPCSDPLSPVAKYLSKATSFGAVLDSCTKSPARSINEAQSETLPIASNWNKEEIDVSLIPNLRKSEDVFQLFFSLADDTSFSEPMKTLVKAVSHETMDVQGRWVLTKIVEVSKLGTIAQVTKTWNYSIRLQPLSRSEDGKRDRAIFLNLVSNGDVSTLIGIAGFLYIGVLLDKEHNNKPILTAEVASQVESRIALIIVPTSLLCLMIVAVIAHILAVLIRNARIRTQRQPTMEELFAQFWRGIDHVQLARS